MLIVLTGDDRLHINSPGLVGAIAHAAPDSPVSAITLSRAALWVENLAACDRIEGGPR